MSCSELTLLSFVDTINTGPSEVVKLKYVSNCLIGQKKKFKILIHLWIFIDKLRNA